MPIPNNITGGNILDAIAEIDRTGVPVGRKSTKFDLEFNNRRYPPKYVISIANRFANGIELKPRNPDGSILFDTDEAQSYLKKFQFSIVPKPTKT